MEASVREFGICPDPIFVVGAPRSATSTLGLALGEHTHLWSSGESIVLFPLFGNQKLDRIFSRIADRPGWTWFRREDVQRSEFFEYAGLGLNALLTSRSNGKRWVDHTPIYALMADTIAELFPGAVFIHILRDGRRVVNSMIHFLDVWHGDAKRKLIDGGFVPKWATDFRDACQTWCNYVEAMTAFQEQQPARCLTVVNEDLVANAGSVFARIFAFLRIPSEEGPVTHFRSNRHNSSFEPDSTVPMTLETLANPWDEWSPEQRTIFKEEAGALLITLGFATPDELDVHAAGAASSSIV